MKPRVGVLALQGCVERHRPHIEAAGGEYVPVKTAADMALIDALILPGGESTSMLKLIDSFGLEPPLRKVMAARPVWGICAGAILLAQAVTHPAQKSFGLLPIGVRRNFYGRQLDSMTMEIENYPVCFIRAPVIEKVNDEKVEILASRDGRPVWLQSGQYMATTFHPELTLSYPSPMHSAFIAMIPRLA